MACAKPPQRDGLAVAVDELQRMPFNIIFFEKTMLFPSLTRMCSTGAAPMVTSYCSVAAMHRASTTARCGPCLRLSPTVLRAWQASAELRAQQILHGQCTRDMAKDVKRVEVTHCHLCAVIAKRTAAIGAAAIDFVGHNGAFFGIYYPQ